MTVFSAFANNPASFTQFLTSFSVKSVTYFQLNLCTAEYKHTSDILQHQQQFGAAVVNLEATAQINI